MNASEEEITVGRTNEALSAQPGRSVSVSAWSTHLARLCCAVLRRASPAPEVSSRKLAACCEPCTATPTNCCPDVGSRIRCAWRVARGALPCSLDTTVCTSIHVQIYKYNFYSFHSFCEGDSLSDQNPFTRTLRHNSKPDIGLLTSHPLCHCFLRPSRQSYAYCVVAALSIPPPVHELSGRTTVTSAFRKCWVASTADNNLTLHGFRRFKAWQLLNLRILENEMAAMDHTVYQAGLGLGLSPGRNDRLGLAHSKRDADVPKVEDVITQDFILKLRDLIKQYSMCWLLCSESLR